MSCIGKEITSIITGKKGFITKVDGNTVYLSFESAGSIPVQIKDLNSILVMDEELNQLVEECKKIPRMAKVSNKSINTHQEKKYFFKFEGKALSGDIIQDINSVEDNGERIYILNFKNRPSLSFGDEFFIVKSYTDQFNHGQASIYGKGSVEGLEENSFYKEEWINQLPWLPHHPHYVVVKECEFLNTSISNGILIRELVDRYGSDLYLSTQGREIEIEKLYSYHNRRSHMFTSELTFNLIEEIFIEKANKYVTLKYKRY